MSFTVIIPARFASTRLPGKPLLDIAGKPMVQHVYERAMDSEAERVLIATDDERIRDVAQGFGADVCMTSTLHQSGTDRLQEVVSTLSLAGDHIVVNVQGDEPLIPPAVINQVANNLASNNQAGISTLVESISDYATVMDPGAVKVTMDNQGNALYFSRAPIPWCRDHFAVHQTLPKGVQYFRHVGIYAYRASFLNSFVTWPMGLLEDSEKLEQLRALENGIKIHAAQAVEAIPAGIDTAADLEHVRSLLKAS